MGAEARGVNKEVEWLLGLSGEEFRNAVLNNAGALSNRIKSLPTDARQRLAEIVLGAWPDNGVHAHIERDEQETRFHDLGAYAWLTLAPALDIAPTEEQWADLATSGAILTDHSEWLSRHYSETAAVRAARSCDAAGARPWAQLISAIPDETRVPDEVVEALVSHVSEPTVAELDFELWMIGDRFAREGRLEALQTLSAKTSDLDRCLRPWRARLGEADAARVLLRELTTALKERKRFERDDAQWLEGVQERALLPDLFEALAAALPGEGESPFGVSTAVGRAIYRIGGEDAVRMYDDLIAGSDDSRFKFLRLQRDEIVQVQLRVAGQRHVSEVAKRLNIPALDVTAAADGP
jgi:hypothetical protein